MKIQKIIKYFILLILNFFSFIKSFFFQNQTPSSTTTTTNINITKKYQKKKTFKEDDQQEEKKIKINESSQIIQISTKEKKYEKKKKKRKYSVFKRLTEIKKIRIPLIKIPLPSPGVHTPISSPMFKRNIFAQKFLQVSSLSIRRNKKSMGMKSPMDGVHSPVVNLCDFEENVFCFHSKEVKIVKCSEQQKGLFYEFKKKRDSSKYNLSIGTEIIGNLNVEKLKMAIEKSKELLSNVYKCSRLVEKDEELFYVFEDLKQKKRRSDFKFVKLEKFSLLPHDKFKRSFALEVLKKHVRKPFNLLKGPLYEFVLVKYEKEKFLFVIRFHHIISDGFTLHYSLKSVADCYNEILYTDKIIRTTSTMNIFNQVKNVTTEDFVNHFNMSYTEKDKEEDIKYWNDVLRNAELRFDFKIRNDDKYSISTKNVDKGSRSYFKIKERLYSDIMSLVKETETTLFVVICSLFNAFLYRYFGQNDITISYATNIRPKNSRFQYLPGFFVNRILLRTQLDKGLNFYQLNEKISKQRNNDRSRVRLSFNDLVKGLRKENPNFDPNEITIALSQTVFVVENAKFKNVGTKLLETQDYGDVQNDFALFYQLLKKKKYIVFAFEYAKRIFNRKKIEKIKNSFINFLIEVVKHPEKPIFKQNVISQSEFNRQVYEWNNNSTGTPLSRTRYDYTFSKREFKTIQEMIETVCELKPDNIAVEHKREKISYKEFNSKSNQWAHYLRDEFDVKPEKFVGICIEKSIDCVVCILGLIKAGGVYFPLDSNYPDKRIKYMMEDTKCETLIINSKFKKKFSWFGGNLIEVENDNYTKFISSNPVNLSNRNSLVYIIYTSGSTGKPKGVLIEHKGLVNLCNENFVDRIGLTNNESLGVYFSSVFDGNIAELFPALANGLKLVIIPEEVRLDCSEIRKIIIDGEISGIHIPPALLKVFPEEPIPFLKTIIIAGEACCKDTVKFWRKHVKNLVNAYGATEGTCCSHIKILDEDNKCNNIGKALKHVTCYILNDNLRLLPIGVPGELLIGGICLARGYLNRDELTCERFIDDPFRNGERVYRTGDLCSFTENGELHYLGRIDFQVKIRGFRIELGEIENVIKGNHEVKNVKVLVKEDCKTKDKQLVAYILIENPGRKELKNRFKSLVSIKLPNYMVPSHFIFLNNMPLNFSGKIDRKKLLCIRIEEDEDDGVFPTTETERELHTMWCHELNLKRISLNSAFFEIGGHSLLATSLLSKIQTKFEISFAFQDFFKCDTILKMSKKIDVLKKSIGINRIIHKIKNKPDRIPLSFAQERMFIVDQLNSESNLYMIPFAFKIYGKSFNLEIFERSINLLIKKYEIMRTNFKFDNGKTYQEIKDFNLNDKFKVDCIYVSSKEMVIETIKNELTKKFDLEKDRLFRIKLFNYENQSERVLFFNFHHIIFDLTSKKLFINDLSRVYNSLLHFSDEFDVVIGDIQYSDFTIWQKIYLSDEILESQMKFWENKLTDYPELLELPLKIPRNEKKSNKGDKYTISIDDMEIIERMRKISQEYELTFFIFFFSVYQILLQIYSRQKKIVVGIPFSNRHYGNSDVMFGFFVNVLPFPVDLENNPSFVQILHQVKDSLFEIYENQDLPFEKIIQYLKIERNPHFNSIFQTMFDFINKDEGLVFELQCNQSDEFNNLKIETFDNIIDMCKISKFDLSLIVTELANRIDFTFEYSSELLDRSTIESMGGQLIEIINKVVEYPEIGIENITFLSEETYNELIYNWNTFNNPELSKSNSTVLKVFNDIVKKYPKKIAVEFGDKRYDYCKLNEISSKIANYMLYDSKVNMKGKFIGICIEKSINLIAAIMAVVKVGGIYFPLDYKFPNSRMEYMINDTKCEYMIINKRYKKKIEKIFKGKIYEIENENINKHDKTLEIVNVLPSDVIYVIYTSGSTGKPKGVLIENKSLLNLSYNFFKNLKLKSCFTNEEGDSFGFYFNNVFDGHIAEIFPSLLNGLKIIIIPEDARKDIDKLEQIIVSHKLSGMHIPPGLLKIIPTNDKSSNFHKLKTIIVAGESCDFDTMKYWSENVETFLNCYGPTEICVCSNQCNWNSNKSNTNIGYSIKNVKLYILNDHLKPVPVECPGELFIGGVQLARGYLNRSDLTNEKFIKNPFEENERMYKTGDLCKYLLNGEVLFIGRIDLQVKIRGYRIELAEIENCVRKVVGVEDCIVLVREKNLMSCIIPTDKKFIVNNFESKKLKGEIMEYLSSNLPEYMVPKISIFIEKFPLNFSGKIDRKKLICIHIQEETKLNYVKPRNSVENELIKMWKNILFESNKVDKTIGINENFFNLGGDSLRATQLVLMIRKKFKCQKFLLKDLMMFPTVKKIYENFLIDNINSIEIFDDKTSFNNEIEMLRKIMKNVPTITKSKKAFDKGKLLKIFITGSTGFVGKNVVKDLLESKEVDLHVYLLTRKITNSWSDDDRVKEIKGDLSLDLFGLKEKEFEVLSNEIDVIVHLASHVNHLLSYYDLYDTNVKSIFDLIKLAQYTKPIFYVSSSSVYNISNDFFSKRLPILDSLSKDSGYISSKYVFDSLLHHCYRNYVILRTSLIIGNTENGEINMNDWFNHLIDCFIRFKIAPREEDITKVVFDMFPVNFLTKSLSSLVFNLSNRTDNERIFNICFENVSLNEIINFSNLYISKYNKNGKIIRMKAEQWNKDLQEKCETINHPFKPFIKFFTKERMKNFYKIIPKDFEFFNMIKKFQKKNESSSVSSVLFKDVLQKMKFVDFEKYVNYYNQNR